MNNTIPHTWACECGTQERCTAEQTQLGRIWECKGCRVVWACVQARPGNKVWIKVSSEDVVFHDLLGKRYFNEEIEDGE